MRFRDGVLGLATGMRKIPPEEIAENASVFGKLGKVFTHLPFSRLENMGNHDFPSLKVWPKAKTFECEGGYPATWTQVRWRPISSYSRHHWRNLLAMGGTFATAAIDFVGWGWSIADPRKFVEEVHLWNEEAKPKMDLDGEQEEEVEVCVLDVRDFFPSVDLEELRVAIREVVDAIKKKDSSLQFY